MCNVLTLQFSSCLSIAVFVPPVCSPYNNMTDTYLHGWWLPKNAKKVVLLDVLFILMSLNSLKHYKPGVLKHES